MSYDEGDTAWARPFVEFFAGASIVWLLLIPFVSAGFWLAGAGGTFAVLEGIGLARHRDRLPPLTFITRRYVPQWLTAVVVGFYTGLAGGYWFGFAHPWRLAALLALFSWLTEHFSVTYSEGGK